MLAGYKMHNSEMLQFKFVFWGVGSTCVCVNFEQFWNHSFWAMLTQNTCY